MGRFTYLFAVIAAALCLVHYYWHDSDPIYTLFYALSIPAWVAPLFTDITTVNIGVIYVLTIAAWALVGFLIDLFARRGSYSKYPS
jgi:hypothetical protein